MDRQFFKTEEGVYLTHVALFSVIYTIYGQHICPILNSKDFFAVLAPCAGVLFVLAFARKFIRTRMETLATDANLRWSFWADFALFLFAGALISTFNSIYFRVPDENVMKVAVSFAALGYYISLDMSLRREHGLAHKIISGEAEFPENGKSMPVTQEKIAMAYLEKSR